MEIVIAGKPIARRELAAIAEQQFGNLVKAVVDVERAVMAVGGELHADEEAVLLERGSKQEHLWGINLYPKREDDQWVEFDSMINIRPSQGNSSRVIADPAVQERIREIIRRIVT